MLVLDHQEIRRNLERQKVILRERLQNQAETDEAQGAINPNRSDLASRYGQQDRDKLLLARAQQQLTEIERALERLADGSYGSCTACGQAIRSERLDVMPAAALCIHCQQQEERP